MKEDSFISQPIFSGLERLCQIVSGHNSPLDLGYYSYFADVAIYCGGSYLMLDRELFYIPGG